MVVEETELEERREPSGDEVKKLHEAEHWKLDKMKWLCKEKGWLVKDGALKDMIKRGSTCQWFELPVATSLASTYLKR